MVAYAGIGSRSTPRDIIHLMHLIARELAKKGYTCNTGAAQGADQAFAEGALAGYGHLALFLPWDSYAQGWRRNLSGNIDTYVLGYYDKEAYASVKKYHPASDRLGQGAMKLHARNYLIINNVKLVICWTKAGGITGGTGQGIRLALDNNIPVHNLGDFKTLKMYTDRLTKLGVL